MASEEEAAVAASLWPNVPVGSRQVSVLSSSRRQRTSNHHHDFMISSAASTIAFESLPIDLFRIKLKESLISVVTYSSSSSSSPCCSSSTSSTTSNNDGWIHYNQERLIECLRTIDWEDLCRDYDNTSHLHKGEEQRHDKQRTESLQMSSPVVAILASPTTTTKPSTALVEVLALLLNPMVLPSACHGSLMRVLVTILLERSNSSPSYGTATATSVLACGANHHRHSWTPSEQLLLQVLVQDLMTRYSSNTSSIRQLTAVIVSWIRQHSNENKPLDTLIGLRRVLALMKFVEQSLPQKGRSTISDVSNKSRMMMVIRQLLHVPVLVEMLSCLDRLDAPANVDGIDEASSGCVKSRATNKSQQHQQYQRKRPRDRYLSSQQTTDLWHGELSDEEEELLHRKLYRRRRSLGALSTDEWSLQEQDDTSSLALTNFLNALQSKCVKRFVKAVTGDNLVASSALKFVILHPWSPSLRLVIVLALSQHHKHQCTPPHRPNWLLWQDLLNGLWDRILHLELQHQLSRSSSTSAVTADYNDSRQATFAGLLHYYGELLGDCAWLHTHPRHLIAALVPLLERVTLTYGSHGKDKRTDVELSTLTRASTAYRCCVVYIWSRRGRSIVDQALQRSSTRPTLSKSPHSTMDAWQQMTTELDQWQDWYHEAWYSNRLEIQLALQVAGIISVCEGNDLTASSHSASSLYPNAIRDLASRLSLDATLLSQCFSAPNYTEPPNATTNAAPAEVLAPNYWNRDLIQHILSYLGYKRLLRMRLVNQEWKEIADHNHLWLRAYQSRFGFHPNDPILCQESSSSDGISMDWKQVFIDNWMAERPIRFRRCLKSGWKVRLCRFVGCHEVLTTCQQAQRHESSHLAKPKKARRSTNKRKATDSPKTK